MAGPLRFRCVPGFIDAMEQEHGIVLWKQVPYSLAGLTRRTELRQTNDVNREGGTQSANRPWFR